MRKSKPRQRRQRLVEVDLDALRAIAHACDGCAGKPRQACCSQYEICVSEDEIAKVDGFIAEAASECAHLRSGDGYENVFEPVDGGLYAIDADDEGCCVFAFEHDGSLRCSLHAAALRLGAPVNQAKPRSCILWPLALSSGRDKTLTVVDDAMRFHCNARRRARSLHPSVIEILDDVFGDEFSQAVQQAARDGETAITLPLPVALRNEP